MLGNRAISDVAKGTSLYNLLLVHHCIVTVCVIVDALSVVFVRDPGLWRRFELADLTRCDP